MGELTLHRTGYSGGGLKLGVSVALRLFIDACTHTHITCTHRTHTHSHTHTHRVNHSKNAIVKPQGPTAQEQKKEVEEAMRRVREATMAIAEVIDPGRPRNLRMKTCGCWKCEPTPSDAMRFVPGHHSVCHLPAMVLG